MTAEKRLHALAAQRGETPSQTLAKLITVAEYLGRFHVAPFDADGQPDTGHWLQNRESAQAFACAYVASHPGGAVRVSRCELDGLRMVDEVRADQ